MNERIKELAQKAGLISSFNAAPHRPDIEHFAKLIYKDIITVVAAQALLNESALDVFKNLKRIYEGEEQ